MRNQLKAEKPRIHSKRTRNLKGSLSLLFLFLGAEFLTGCGVLWSSVATRSALAVNQSSNKNFLYVCTQNFSTPVVGYGITATGALTPITGSLPTSDYCYDMTKLTISNTDQLLFLATAAGYSAYKVNSDGNLTAAPGVATNTVDGIKIDPLNRFVYGPHGATETAMDTYTVGANDTPGTVSGPVSFSVARITAGGFSMKLPMANIFSGWKPILRRRLLMGLGSRATGR